MFSTTNFVMMMMAISIIMVIKSNALSKHIINVPDTMQGTLHLVSHVFGRSFSYHNSNSARILSEFSRNFLFARIFDKMFITYCSCPHCSLQH